MLTLKEAFQHQLENTRLLVEEDFNDDNEDSLMPVVWNGVIFRPETNAYSSGKEMKVGDKLVAGYLIAEEVKPIPIWFEESELDEASEKFEVVRIIDNIPVMEKKLV